METRQIVAEIIKRTPGAQCLTRNGNSVILATSTQELVDYLIGLNTHNRSLRSSHVSQIARDMEDGHYHFTAQGIGVASDGSLSDGQHRLVANREAGYPPVTVIIATGLNPEAQSVVDQHARRRVADALSFLLNTTVTTRLVAALNIIAIVRGLLVKGERLEWAKTNKAPSIREVQDMYVDWMEEAEVAACADFNAPVNGTLMSFARHFSLEKALDFQAKLKSGANLEEDHPALRLKALLAKTKSWDRWTKLKIIRTTASACLAFHEGRTLRLLKESDSW